MTMKETYLSRDFRETAVRCFPSQSKELNAFFDARLNVLLAENADAAHVVEADYCGVVSGNNTPNKFEASGLTVTKSDKDSNLSVRLELSDSSVFVGGMNHVIVVTERIVLFIVCYADKMCSKERWA